MSNLGTVYEIDTKLNEKNKYPIVYSNKTYYYCKQYGSDELVRFRISYCKPIEYFYQAYQRDGYFCGNLFAPAGKEVDIPKLPEEIVLKNEINTLVKQLESLEKSRNSFIKSIDDLKESVVFKEGQIRVTREKISSLYKHLSTLLVREEN